jgi:diguanylate cyclase (GGDEF)-like protein
MAPLVHAALFVRRAARRAHGLVLAGLLGAWVVAGGAGEPLGLTFVAAVVLWGTLLVVRVKRKLAPESAGSGLLDVELGALLAVGVDAALLRFEGGLEGSFSPAIYILVALLASFARPLAGLVVVAWVVGLEVLVRRVTLGETAVQPILTHAAFALAFALLNLAFLRAEVARVRIGARARLEDELKRLKDDARRYRLLGAGDSEHESAKGDGRLERSSVEEIHQSVHYALDLLRRTLNLHTAVLLWLNDAGTHLRISELSTESDDINDAPFSVGDGILAVALARAEKASFATLTPSYKVPYYAGPCPVRVLSAIPVMDEQTLGESRASPCTRAKMHGCLRGVLAIDRTEDAPFTPHEEELAAQAARWCLRAIQNERVFMQLERAKVEQGKLYRAAKALGAALGEEKVLEEGVRAAREIASFDLAAITLYDEKTKMHEVRSVSGDAADLAGARFQHNSGLVSMVVQNRFPLPYRGEYDSAHQIVLTRRFPWPKLPSLLVLPLLMHDRALGTLILGAKRRHAFGDAVRPTLEVLASHLAVSLSNARVVRQLEQMATTDGLTGLLNKRAMLEDAQRRVAAAARFDRNLAVLVTDIDFFKKVNDTHGHDVGDVVIRGLGEILKRQKRATDVVARFGGEEFVVLCEETNEQGAVLLAERIRDELKKTVFHAANTTIAITCSIGVATFPDAGRDWDALFKAADDALYVSKRTGRDRVTAWRAKTHSESPRQRRRACS